VETLTPTSYEKVSISPIPQTSLVSFWNAPGRFEQTSLHTVSVVGGETKTIFSSKFGADFLWSPDGKKSLVSFVDEKNNFQLVLGTADMNETFVNLGIPTFVSKCAWSRDAKTVYHAHPSFIPDGSTLPDDYTEKKFNTRDTFWKVNTDTGEKERIVKLEDIEGEYDASNLFLSPSEDMLFFINRADGMLYGMRI
jgi:hypothetical protein